MSNRDEVKGTENKSPVLATYQLHAATPKIVFFDETMLLIVQISRLDQESFENFVQNHFNRTETVSKSSLPFHLPNQKKPKFAIEIEGEGLFIKEDISWISSSDGSYKTSDFNAYASPLQRKYFKLKVQNYANFDKRIVIKFLFDRNPIIQIHLDVEEVKTLSCIGRILRFVRKYGIELGIFVAILALLVELTGLLNWTPDPPTATPTYIATTEEPVTFTPDATQPATVTSTFSVTETPSVTPTITPSVTTTVTFTPTSSTPSLTPSATFTPSATATFTPTNTPSLTNSVTFTPPSTPSLTPSATFTATLTPSATHTPTIAITLSTYEWQGDCVSVKEFSFPVPFATFATDIDLEPISFDDWKVFRDDPGSGDIPAVVCKDKDNIDRYNISVYWSSDAAFWLTFPNLNLYPLLEVPYHISAYEAMAYCRWNAWRSGRSDGRLPTLAEWQNYATQHRSNFKYAQETEREWLWKSESSYQHLINPTIGETSDEGATTGKKDANDMIFRCAYTD